MPKLLPPAKPRFCVLRMTLTWGKRSAIKVASSALEALSTTITSIDASSKGNVSISSQVSLTPL